MEEGNEKVAVAGYISLDITPVLQNSGEQKLLELFQPEKLLKVGKAMICTGGAVSNTGPGPECLGADVVLMAKTRNDCLGNTLKGIINAYDCETCISQVPSENTSYTTVLAPKGLDRSFLHDPSCNNTSGCGDADLERIGEASHSHLGYPPIIRRFHLDEGEELVRLFRKIKFTGLTAPLDLVVVDPGSEATGMDWIGILERVSPYVDFFVPSIEGLGCMLDRPLYCKWQGKAGGGDVTGTPPLEGDVKPLAAKALSMGTRCILLKCGAVGIYLKAAPEPIWRKFLPESTGWDDISYFEDSYVSDYISLGTGVGGINIAALVKAMLNGRGPLECIHLAAATGASCAMAYDTLSGLLFSEELRQKVGAGQEKQDITHL